MRRYGKILLLLTLACIFMLALAADAAAEGILDDTRFPDMALRQALADKYGDAHHYVDFVHTEDLNLANCGMPGESARRAGYGKLPVAQRTLLLRGAAHHPENPQQPLDAADPAAQQHRYQRAGSERFRCA